MLYHDVNLGALLTGLQTQGLQLECDGDCACPRVRCLELPVLLDTLWSRPHIVVWAACGLVRAWWVRRAIQVTVVADVAGNIQPGLGAAHGRALRALHCCSCTSRQSLQSAAISRNRLLYSKLGFACLAQAARRCLGSATISSLGSEEMP